MNTITLQYKSRTYELALFDGFYITTKNPSTSGTIESILNCLNSGRINSFMNKTNVRFNVLVNNQVIDVNTFNIALFN